MNKTTKRKEKLY